MLSEEQIEAARIAVFKEHGSDLIPAVATSMARAIEAEVRKQEREACALLAEQAHPHDWPFIGAAIRGRARLEDAK